MVCTGILISKWLAVQCLRCGWVPPPPPWPPLLSSTETLAAISSSLKWFTLMPIEGKNTVKPSCIAAILLWRTTVLTRMVEVPSWEPALLSAPSRFMQTSSCVQARYLAEYPNILPNFVPNILLNIQAVFNWSCFENLPTNKTFFQEKIPFQHDDRQEFIRPS